MRLIKNSPKPSTGTIITNDVASEPPIIYAIMMQNIIISGARIAVRIIIMYDIWTLVISVVMRVTSEVDENLSIFSNE